MLTEQAALAKGKQKLPVHAQHRAATLEASYVLACPAVGD